MKELALLVVVAFVLPAAPAWADGSSFSETQSPDDQLFHIDIGIEHAAIGTIKISLPSAQARLDPALQVEPAGYSCQVTTSAYGDAGTGFVCATDGARASTVTVHLLSQECYGPPPEGSARPAVAEVWTAPADPGTPPDASFPLYTDVDCSSADELAVDNVAGARCIVPKLKKLKLGAKVKLTVSRGPKK